MSKEIKSALKAAKTAIQSKEYQEALHHCEFILKRDGGNYNALVFAGLCHSELKQNDQARELYKDAMKCHPEQILAYQGFANLYTKHWPRQKTKDEMKELIEIFKKLLDLMGSKEIKKSLEISLNLSKVYIEVGNPREALEIIRVKISQDSEEDIKLSFCQSVFDTLEIEDKDSGFKVEYSDLITEAFQTLCRFSPSSAKAMKTVTKYLSYLGTHSDIFQQHLSLVLDVCIDLHTKWPKDRLPLEIIIQAYVQNHNHRSSEDIKTYVERLDALGGSFAKVGLGYLEFQAGDYDSAVELLNGVMRDHTTFLPGWVTLCKVMCQLHKYMDAENMSKNALLQYKQIANGSKEAWLLPITSLENVRFDLTKCFATSLCASHSLLNVEKGVATFEKLLNLNANDIGLFIHMAKGLVKMERFGDASNAIDKALAIRGDHTDAMAWREYVSFKAGNVEEPITRLQSLLPSATSLFLLGKCMWEAGGEHRTAKKNCFTALVKAAKLDSNNGETFLLLGHFYAQVQKDNTRAKGCYQKSYQLDPASEEVAACLADVYVAEGDTDSAIALYERITKEAGPNSCKWAWLRLGLCRLKAKDINNAIQCFQCALRIDSDDAVCWECLGEGYLHRGSYTAAWKAFGRAHELDAASIYSLYQMAKVKQVQGLYPDAIKEYTGVLKLSPNYVPGLQGLAESELLLARQLMREGRYLSSIDHVEKAMQHLTVACMSRRDLCCLWKLLGDCCIMVHPLDVSIVQMKIPTVLLGPRQNDGDKLKVTGVGKNEVLALSARFYCRAISLQPENASLWHDLGLSYIKQAKDENTADKSVEFPGKAVDALKKAITLEPSNHVFWNSLGVIASSKYINDPALAQHCFLMSVKQEQNNVQAWSNLATLYLSHEHVKKAHEAFKVAQSLDPSFVNSWVGQAIIAETVGSNETMDLYRHSTELGIQKQGGAGYSTWVMRVMADRDNRESLLFKDNIRNMNAVATATTQMSKQCDKDPQCGWSSNVHGFLLEYSGLNRSAEEAYTRACTALCLTKEQVQDEDLKEEMQANFNKTASNLARVQCQNGRYSDAIDTYQKISPLTDFYDVCGLALAFYKSAQYIKALEAYKQAGQLTTVESEKAQVMVAMAMTFWKLGKRDEAKTLLYKCFQTSKSGLQALCALGILAEDRTLVGAAVGEVMKQKATNRNQSEQNAIDDCLLVSSAAILCGDEKMAIYEVQKALHQYPSSWSIRTLLCRLLVSLNDTRRSRSVSAISTQATRLFRNDCASNPLDRDSEFWKGSRHHQKHVSMSQCHSVSTLAAGDAKSRFGLLEDSKCRLRQAQIFAHMHPQNPSSWAYLSCAYQAKNVAHWFSGTEVENTNLVERLANAALDLIPDDGSVRDGLEKWKQRIASSSRVWAERPAENDENASLQEMVSKILKQGQNSPQSLLLQALTMRTQENHRKSKQLLNRVLNSSDLISDDTRSIAVWYLYRTLYERNDTSEIEKLVSKASDSGDNSIARIQKLLPV